MCFFLVALCHSDSEDSGFEVSDVGEEESDAEEVFGFELSSAPGIETLCVFPKNSAKSSDFSSFLTLVSEIRVLSNLVCVLINQSWFVWFSSEIKAGVETELLVGMKNDGKGLIFIHLMITWG